MVDTEWPGNCKAQSMKEKLKTSRVLAVGAGGIGCELLKTLVLTGFENIEVIDMDTIETSNLNRQFLFRKRHVGQSKAAIAAQAVQQFRPSAKITAHQANIKEPQFGLDFFKGFDIVLNGLDNLEARRHVNRLCLASRTPLVESGTAGYLGQVSVHMRLTDQKGNIILASECFECQPKAAPKSYPVCTIRNTPDKPIHCIVWAKDLLFQRLFGSPDVTTDLDEKTPEEQDADAKTAENGHTSDDVSEFLRRPDEDAKSFVSRIFERIYNKDIERLLTMEDLWKTRRKPQSIADLSGMNSEACLSGLNQLRESEFQKGSVASSLLGLKDNHKPWSLLENIQVFLLSIILFMQTRAKDVGSAVFDKDDDLAVEFVTAASNLRASCYHIPAQSLFDAKGMAGNIIHAIATTNATIAGMIVVEAMKILAGLPKSCKMSYLQQIPSGRRLITAMTLCEPNPGCVVCGTAQLHLTINTAETTLNDFINKVLKKRLAMNEPTIMAGSFAYEEGADLEPDEIADNARLLPIMLDKLPGGGLQHGTIAEWEEDKEAEGFLLLGAVPDGKANGNGVTGIAGPGEAEMGENDDGDIEILDEDAAQQEASKRKRQASPGSPNSTLHKKRPIDSSGAISID